MAVCILVNLFHVCGLVWCWVRSGAKSGKLDSSRSCFRLGIRPFACGSPTLARRSFLARALSSRFATEFRKLSLHCLILEAMSSDPSSVFSAEEGQRVGSPWIVRKIFLWTRSTILSSVLVRVHSSAPYKRVGIERERVIEPV